MSLLVIDISLDMEVPWRDCDPLQFHISELWAHPHYEVRRKGSD